MNDLKSDKYEKMLEGDGSYGGLMFFAFLQEPHFEEKLSQIITDVDSLHASCHGSTSHVSFNDLRAKIDVLVDGDEGLVGVARHRLEVVEQRLELVLALAALGRAAAAARVVGVAVGEAPDAGEDGVMLLPDGALRGGVGTELMVDAVVRDVGVGIDREEGVGGRS